MSYRKLFAPIILVIFLLSLVPTSLSTPSQGQLKIIGSAWILAPAVAQTQTGMIGSATNISVFVTEGWGDVYVSTYSLTQEDFQGAATAAARVVTRLLGLNFSNYNYYFKVQETR
jgi:Archaeal serine proteases